jgi:NRPS condensation-like uncharacterized protein
MAEMLRQKAQLPSQNCQNSQVIIQVSLTMYVSQSNVCIFINHTVFQYASFTRKVVQRRRLQSFIRV